jgi:serine/threonine-protein kinase
MVVTWCDGIDLHKYLNRANNGRSFQPTVWESIRRVKALAHLTNALHQHCRIIHGDIKPPNLVLPSDPGSIAIIDYGSSWQIERTRGRSEGDGVDVHYSAPEVLQNSAVVDGRADQFSIAVVLFRMLFGTVPYAGLGGQAGDPDCRSEFENKLEFPTDQADELSKIPDSIRSKIELLLAKSLRLHPEDRFPTTRAFVNAIDSIHDRLKQARSLKPGDFSKPNSVTELWRRLWKKKG